LVLADSSAWIEYFRGTGSKAHTDLRDLIATQLELVFTTEVVVMELLASARDAREYAKVADAMASVELLAIQGLQEYVDAADLYRTCRRAGETIRKMTDCVIAAVAIRHGAELLHQDRDFDAIARHTSLRIR
jgi:predicted nucleic acid-binding protein